METAFIYQRRVEFSETDMAGIVHFSNFLRFVEAAEHAFFRANGASIHSRGPDADGNRFGWPRVSVQCDYLAPLRFEEIAEVRLLVAEVRSRSVRYLFRVTRLPDGVVVARGSVTSVCVLLNAAAARMEAIPIPDSVRTWLCPASPETVAEWQQTGVPPKKE
jgi:YbgC/YbaW family acyl-CoA thioester hydrolase